MKKDIGFYVIDLWLFILHSCLLMELFL
jgi:hypothetical protein